MLNIWLTLIVIIFIVYILRLVAKKVVELRNVISWLILCLLSLPVIWFPNLIGQVSKMLGIQVPSNLIFFLGFCLLVYLNFSLDSDYLKQSVQIRTIVSENCITGKRAWRIINLFQRRRCILESVRELGICWIICTIYIDRYTHDLANGSRFL